MSENKSTVTITGAPYVVWEEFCLKNIKSGKFEVCFQIQTGGSVAPVEYIAEVSGISKFKYAWTDLRLKSQKHTNSKVHTVKDCGAHSIRFHMTDNL